MAAARRLLIDESAGETRGVVLLHGRPERLLIEPAGAVDAGWLHGERLVARVVRLERGLGMAFLDAAGQALTAAPAGLTEGARVVMRVTAPARAGKLAAARLEPDATPAEAPLGRLAPAPDLEARLRAFAPAASVERGAAAREAADLAQAQALAVEHPLPGGARLTIEPTRALVAVDVDLGGSAAGGDAKRRQRAANLAALAELARLLRLKGLGGLVVVDLAGKGHDGPALARAAREAFAADEPGVSLGAISRFGLFELQLPWRDTPLAERLTDGTGALSLQAAACALLRRIEQEAGPGAHVEASAAPEVIAAASAFAARLIDRIGPRFTLTPDPSLARDAFEVRRR
jgi:Ribonuclease G/E